MARSLERAWEAALSEEARLAAEYERLKRTQTQRPSAAELAAIRDLAVAIPPTDAQTYLTSFDLRANMTGLFAGKSDNEQNVLALVDRLRAGGRFSDIRCKLDPRSGRGGPSELSFFVTFIYLPQK